MSTTVDAAELDVPSQIIPAGHMAEVTIAVPEPDPASRQIIKPKLEVLPPAAVAKRDAWQLYECDCLARYLVSGEPGTYTARLSKAYFRKRYEVAPDPTDPENRDKWELVESIEPVFGPDWTPQIEVVEATFVIGAEQPDDPEPPDPVDPPPGPTPVDPWGVAKAVQQSLAGLPPASRQQATATADLFDHAADGLLPRDGNPPQFPSLGAAQQWLKAAREQLWGARAADWQPVVDAINEVYARVDDRSKATMIDFFRAIAAGLRGAS